MYKNKTDNDLNNVCGKKVREYRKRLPTRPSQRELAVMLQVEGLDVDKNAIQRIECGKRFVTDIELRILAKVLNVTYKDLLDEDSE